ncbi:MAG: hypothetical protein K2F79_04830, partial [Muribaculaceae bacterium]|nr:hypothetical protein [Muribaculaceae bacterium]
VDVEILSCQEYDKIVGKKQRREQFWCSVISGAVTVANVYAYDSSQSDLVLYESNRRYDDEYRAMKASNEQIRHQFGQDYVKTHTIPGGTDYSGFFNMKFNKNMNELEYSVLIDGETYTFNVSVQSDTLVPLPFFDSLSL